MFSDEPTLARSFFAGDYDEVLAASADRPEFAAHPLAIGSLALVGRLDEAQIATSLLTRRAQQCPDNLSVKNELTAARFFLCAGYCHAGRLPLAMAAARQNLPAVVSSSAVNRFFACQGLGLARYFEGQMGRAALFAKRALRSAMEAGLPYARLLALDLRGHILVQTGHLYAGLRLLRQAEQLAFGLGFGPNAETIAAGILDYEIGRRLPGALERIHKLESAARNTRVAFFARRNALCELAWVRALEGKRDLAEAALREVIQIALPDADRRGRMRVLLAQGAVQRLSYGTLAADPMFSEARRMAGNDPALRVELAFAENSLSRRTGPDDGMAALARKTGMQRAEVARRLSAGEPNEGVPLEDRLSEVFLMLQTMGAREKLFFLIRESLLGLTPLVLGLEPGRRIVLAGRHLLTENHGEVALCAIPSGPSLRLLEELAQKPRTREALMRAVWGIGNYVPHRHDPTLHTAVTRLRAALAPRSDWVVTTSDGYGLASDVDLVVLDSLSSPHKIICGQRVSDTRTNRRSRALAVIAESREASCAEIADKLELSPASALRLLSSLIASDELVRVGKGKATRYRISSHHPQGAPP